MTNVNYLNNEETLKAVLRIDFSYFIQKSFYTITGGETYHHNSKDIINSNVFQNSQEELNSFIRNINEFDLYRRKDIVIIFCQN